MVLHVAHSITELEEDPEKNQMQRNESSALPSSSTSDIRGHVSSFFSSPSTAQGHASPSLSAPQPKNCRVRPIGVTSLNDVLLQNATSDGKCGQQSNRRSVRALS